MKIYIKRLNSKLQYLGVIGAQDTATSTEADVVLGMTTTAVEPVKKQLGFESDRTLSS